MQASLREAEGRLTMHPETGADAKLGTCVTAAEAQLITAPARADLLRFANPAFSGANAADYLRLVSGSPGATADDARGRAYVLRSVEVAKPRVPPVETGNGKYP